MNSLDEPTEGFLTPSKIVRAIIEGRRLGVLVILLSVLAGFVVIAVQVPQYTASAVIEPPVSTGGQVSGSGQLLASIAGINMSGNADQFTKYMQVLGSVRLAQKLQDDHRLMQHFFNGWDESTRRWKRPDGPFVRFKNMVKTALGMPLQRDPDVAALSQLLRDRLVISLVPGRSPLDLRSQVFNVSIQDKDRTYAQNLLAWILRGADDLVRQDQLAQMANRIKYLNASIEETQEVYLRQSLQQILMTQEQTLMTLKTDKYYAIDLLDPPFAPDIPGGMGAMRIMAISIALGLVFYCILIITIRLRQGAMKKRDTATPARNNELLSWLVGA